MNTMKSIVIYEWCVNIPFCIGLLVSIHSCSRSHLDFTQPPFPMVSVSRGRFKNTYELLNLRALKFSPVNKTRIFQCMGKIFWVEFQRYPLKFHTKYLTHTLKDVILYNIEILRAVRFKSSYAFWNAPCPMNTFLASCIRCWKNG